MMRWVALAVLMVLSFVLGGALMHHKTRQGEPVLLKILEVHGSYYACAGYRDGVSCFVVPPPRGPGPRGELRS